MRVLYLFDGLARGGRERRFVQLIKGLNKRGYYDLYLINTRNIIEYKEIFNYNIHIEFIDRHKRDFLKSLIERINEISPDIVQPWIDVSAAHLDLVYFFLKRRPIYISSFIADCNYSRHSILSKIVMRIAYWLSDYVISNSEAGLDNYKVKGHKRVCIHNGFDFDRLKNVGLNSNIKKELGITTRYIVSMIARMQNNKDFSMYIYAAINILQKRRDVTFLAVGSGPMEEKWRKEVPSQFKNKIIFTGRRDDVDEILNVTDVSVLCSNAQIHGEGISNTILESMASGVPVIATIGGGTIEIVDETTGFLILPKDINDLEEKINLLLDNSDLRENMGKASEYKIKKYFSLEYTTSQYINLYNKSINK